MIEAISLLPLCAFKVCTYRFLLHRLCVLENRVLRKALGLGGGTKMGLLKIA
jgi:hypothetical protein